MARTVAIVPHTHWDREWYSPFQTFRLRLVDLLDEFLPALEADPSYARFLLDGQMAVVDDYLEVRPDAEVRLRRLAGAGRLAMGPWYTLPDEFLVSGESHIRNLQAGLARAASFGGAMNVGYLPDMFGHIAQMPQLFRQFGFEDAVVWRGVPSAIDRTAFQWTAPDGSTVRAQYLARGGYGNGAAVPDDVKALLHRIEAHETELGSMLPAEAGILFMNGTDHQVPQPWLGRVVTEANAVQDDYRFVVTSLAEFLADAVQHEDAADLPRWRGELRSGARANLLMGVASNRVDVKQAAARAERALEREAEPLAALFLPRDAWPGSLLGLAWREMLRNAAHDSICACSHDEVVAAVLHRFAEATQIADGLADRAVRVLAASMADSGPFVVNPSARARGAVIEVTLPTTEPVPGTQVLRSREGGVGREWRARPSDVASLLGNIRDQRLNDTFFVNALDVEETDDAGPTIVLRLGVERAAGAAIEVEEARRAIYARLGSGADGFFTVRTERPPMQRILARTLPVAGYGWARFSADLVNGTNPVRVDDLTMTNGLATVTVDRSDGTFTLDGLGGLDRLVDSGDHGDTYNWCPPANDTVVDTPATVSVEVLEAGPVRATLLVRRRYDWPVQIEGAVADGRRVGVVPTEVETRVELRAGERFVRVGTSFVNASRDHRLRTLFPLAAPATTSRAECAFTVVERGLTAEGGPSEQGLATFPSRRFVAVGDLTVAHEGLLEYELVDGGRALALTLLRSTGLLSQGPMPTRAEPAGPIQALHGSQMLGPVTCRYVVARADGDPYALVDDAFLPLRVATATGGGTRPPSGSTLDVSGAVVSALRRTDSGALEIRLFNPTAEATQVDLGGRSGWLVDLRGRPLEPIDATFSLAPWKIATVHLAE